MKSELSGLLYQAAKQLPMLQDLTVHLEHHQASMDLLLNPVDVEAPKAETGAEGHAKFAMDIRPIMTSTQTVKGFALHCSAWRALTTPSITEKPVILKENRPTVQL
jgi:hypothetical protein